MTNKVTRYGREHDGFGEDLIIGAARRNIRLQQSCIQRYFCCCFGPDEDKIRDETERIQNVKKRLIDNDDRKKSICNIL